MKARIFFLFIPVLLFSVMSGCSDEPSAVGIGLLPPQDSIRIDSIQTKATSDTTFLARISGSSSTLLIGRHDSLEARTLLLFNGISNIPGGSRIDSAGITFRINSRFRDSTGALGFTAYKMLRTWDPRTILWDSTLISGTYNADTVIGTSPPPYFIEVRDSVLKMKVDTTYIHELQRNDQGSMILIPSITSKIVLGFSNYADPFVDFGPELSISYRDSSSDTARTFTRKASLRAFVANDQLPPTTPLVYLEAGISYRGVIRFDSLPIPPRVSITQATLELSIDNNTSLLNNFTRDSLVVYLLRKNTPPFDSLALGALCEPIKIGTQKMYRADIKSIVQQWVTRERNYGILLRTYGEYTTLDRFAFYGAASQDTLRPRVTLKYTVLP